MIHFRKRRVHSNYEIYIHGIFVGFFTAAFHYDQADRGDCLTVDILFNRFLHNVPEVKLNEEWNTYIEEEVTTQNNSQIERIVNRVVENYVLNHKDYKVELKERRHASEYFVSENGNSDRFVLIQDFYAEPERRQIAILSDKTNFVFSNLESEDVIVEIVFNNSKNK
jgi:hypothetical protein